MPIAALASSVRRFRAGRTKTSQKRSICSSEAPRRRRLAVLALGSPECEQRPGDLDAVAEREVPVAEDREGRAADRRNARVLADDGQLEPSAAIRAALADPVEEGEILREAPERDVLPVVRRRGRIAVALGQRLDRAA
jgi:hypothetical protein